MCSIARLSSYLQGQAQSGSRKQLRPAVNRLERTIDMRKQGAMSNTIALSGTVDLESNTKGQVRVPVACVDV
jgi:ATP-binding cassette subfamily F protein 3